MEKQQFNKAREKLAEIFLKALEEKRYEWKKGWSSNGFKAPVNIVGNNKYRGINKFLLMLTAQEHGWNDYRWCTFKQATSKGWKIKKDEHGTPVEYWSMYDKETKKNYTFAEYERIIQNEPERKEDFVMSARIYIVFNGAQIDGIPVLPDVEKNNGIELSEFVENTVKNMGIEVLSGNSAFYSPSTDKITMPEKDTFVSDYEYNSTLLHELSHATGHEDRLNRNIRNTFGTEDYAKEELRAEIASCFISAELPIVQTDSNIENHKAYIQSWIKVIKDDKNELFKAINDAGDITDYIFKVGEIEKYLPTEISQPTYEIYQMKDDDNLAHGHQFFDYDFNKEHGFEIRSDKYNKVYQGVYDASVSNAEELDKLWNKFNVDRPEDFKGHSLSVSDVIVLRNNEKESVYYVDGIGFKEFTDFYRPTSKADPSYNVLHNIREAESLEAATPEEQKIFSDLVERMNEHKEVTKEQPRNK